jgi:GR25 family glycosyltransferase involved in LPS biosynthesis
VKYSPGINPEEVNIFIAISVSCHFLMNAAIDRTRKSSQIYNFIQIAQAVHVVKTKPAHPVSMKCYFSHISKWRAG